MFDKIIFLEYVSEKFPHEIGDQDPEVWVRGLDPGRVAVILVAFEMSTGILVDD